MINLNNGGVSVPPIQRPANMTFCGMHIEGVNDPVYPKWLYRNGKDPIRVHDAEAEAEARSEGWDNITAGSMANKTLQNCFWDFEDMSAKQLSVYAMDEFGVDLPWDADQDRLFMAVIELTKHAPQNRNRLVLMAHTMKMNYDETLEEIKRMVSGAGQGLESETITEVIWA